MSPIGSYIWTLGPHLVVLFEKIEKPLGGGGLLEEVHRSGWVLTFYSMTYLLFSLSLSLTLSRSLAPSPLLPMCVETWSLHPWSSWLHASAAIPFPPWWTISPLQCKPKSAPSLPRHFHLRILSQLQKGKLIQVLNNSELVPQRWSTLGICDSLSSICNSPVGISRQASRLDCSSGQH